MKIDRIFIVLCMVILILGGVFIYACQSKTFNVTQVIIRGNEKITVDEIRKQVKPYLNKNILGLNSTKIEEMLRRDARLKQVQIRKRLPGSLLIDVQEKRPALWVNLPEEMSKFGECGFCGLSIDQEIIPLDRKDLSSDLPVVSGIDYIIEDSSTDTKPQPYQKWTNARIQKALELYKTVIDVDPGAAKMISEINMTDFANPSIYLLPGIKVIMGERSFAEKWIRVRTILSEEKEVDSFSCMDLRFDDQVLLTKLSSYKMTTQRKKQMESTLKD